MYYKMHFKQFKIYKYIKYFIVRPGAYVMRMRRTANHLVL